ncbi:MAG: precorrin-2 C(20)-methyltransferase [Spirochaetota bacterium]
MKGKLYGIGTGPGDPELITVKAARILGIADAVIVPESGSDKGSIALEIAKEYLNKNAEIITLTFPMIRGENERLRSRRENADSVRSVIESGKTAVFLTLGDPMLYSTYIYILDCLAGSGIEIETVPGVTSFCASAAAAGTPLAVQNEQLRIVPLDADTDIARHLCESENIVFMKVSSDSARLADELERSGVHECIIASKCGRDGESISRDIGRLRGDVPYMTTVLVKRKKTEAGCE